MDRNPKAVDLAKLSLWLVTLAKDHPLTFLDHALRPGDALVGLSRRQLDAFHWKDDAKPFQAGFEAMRAREHLAKASGLRRRIREADDSVSEMELRRLCDDARFETDNVRLLGDLALAAFFEGSKPKQREDLRRQFGDAVQRGEMYGYVGWLEELRRKEPPLAPFHWEIEFPEVFDRENPGFDAVVGNPPFAGKNTVAAANVAGYPDWLKQVHEESHGNADLVAHFFRRAFGLLRTGGTSGLIATNTVAQGDTRSTGLRWICNNGGEIFQARRRVKWPGLAAVVVSVLHVHKGDFLGVKLLDGESADTITAFLFHRGAHDDPARLKATAGKSFVGSYVLGMGFTFDDTDTTGVATPLAEMHRLIEEEPRSREAIFPYIGGEEVNTSSTHAHHRYVINFRDYPLRREELGAEALRSTQSPRIRGSLARNRADDPTGHNANGTPAHRPDTASEGLAVSGERALDILGHDLIAEPPDVYPIEMPISADSRHDAAMASWTHATDEQRRELLRGGIVPLDYQGPVAMDWPKLLSIVEDRVRGTRGNHSTAPWWQFERLRPELYTAIADLDRVLVNSQVSAHLQFAFVPANVVYAHTTYVYPLDTLAAFCALQSRTHEIWARSFELTPLSPSSANCTPPWTARSWTSTAGPTSPLTVNSFSTTKSTRKTGAPGRNPTATAGPTRSGTKSSPASWG